MIFRAYHGTNQDFAVFDPAKLGMNNPNTASSSAFFLAGRFDTAWDYAQQAARRLVPQQGEHERRVAEALRQADLAALRGDWRRQEYFTAKAEELEANAIQAPPLGMRVLECEVASEKAMVVVCQPGKLICDLGSLLETAWADGYDLVILEGMCDTPSGMTEPDTHYAVRRADQISIRVRHTDELAVTSNMPKP